MRPHRFTLVRSIIGALAIELTIQTALIASCAADSAPTKAQPAAVTAPPIAAGTLSESMADSYFTSGDAKLGAEKFAAGDYAAAQAAFTNAARGASKEAAPRFELMIALCDAKQQQWDRAAIGFANARTKLPLIEDWIGYQQARALYFAKDLLAAMSIAKSIDLKSIVGNDTELLIGDILRGQTDAKATADYYRTYLQNHASGGRRSEAEFRLAEALEKLSTDEAQRELVGHYRHILIADPLSSWATKATARIQTLAATMEPTAVAAISSFTANELMERAHALFDANRNEDSQAAYIAALKAPDITAAQRCEATYNEAQSLFKARKRKPAEPIFDEAIKLCETAHNIDLEVKSAYQAGRSYAFEKDHKTAIDRYRTAQTTDPKHSYADDALLREGEEWTSLGDDAKLIDTLSTLPTRFPDGDNKAEAMWRLGWHAWRAHKIDDAIGWWKKQIVVAPIDDNYFGEGQAQYWLGRAYAEKHDAKAAEQAWIDTIETYPVTYYAMLALNRLRESSPARFAKLVDELKANPKGFDPHAPAFSFRVRPEWSSPGFLRAMEFLRLGLGEPAEQELRAVGLTAPSDKKRVDDPDRREQLWAMAFLYDRAGRYATSLWPTRWHILDYRRQWPVGANRAKWRIAYPKGYWPLLTDYAARSGQPAAMQIAIVREESGFEPTMESSANAVGLTQMIPSTAERFSQGTGIEPTRENLRDPEKNVAIGSRFLGFLWKRWHGFALLVPTSYNAGEHGVDRMLKVRGDWAADEFVEGIVDDQARNYTKRVLGSYFVYSWLNDADIPVIPNLIPKNLLPKP